MAKKKRRVEQNRSSRASQSSRAPWHFLAGAAFILIATFICYCARHLGRLYLGRSAICADESDAAQLGRAGGYLDSSDIAAAMVSAGAHDVLDRISHRRHESDALSHRQRAAACDQQHPDLAAAAKAGDAWRTSRRVHFCMHPVMVESVAWVTERKNCLSMVFYLLAARTYLAWVGDRGLWVGGSGSGIGGNQNEQSTTHDPRPTTPTHDRRPTTDDPRPTTYDFIFSPSPFSFAACSAKPSRPRCRSRFF